MRAIVAKIISIEFGCFKKKISNEFQTINKNWKKVADTLVVFSFFISVIASINFNTYFH